MKAGPLALPRPVLRVLDEHANHLLQPFDVPVFDFSDPPGEAALMRPDSVSWRIFKNPVAVFIGGVAAVILELAEPAVRAGVWTHSSFRSDPVRRLQRTGLATMVTVYGASSRARAMIQGVVRRHEQVTGTTEHGRPYRATEPELLKWVQATATWGFAQAYSRYVQNLGDDELRRLYLEAEPAARLYGAQDAPIDVAQMHSLFARMAPRLEPSPVIFEFLQILRRAPILPAWLRPVQKVLVGAAVELVPADLRRQLGIGPGWSLNAGQFALVRMIARSAERTLLPSSPAVQSCLRLRLPQDYLYSPRSPRQRQPADR